jgi:hypothetical protein
MVVIIRATNAPFARAKAGDVRRASEAAQTVVGKKWHDMRPGVYTRPARRKGLPAQNPPKYGEQAYTSLPAASLMSWDKNWIIQEAAS